jgi:hypothetical protein
MTSPYGLSSTRKGLVTVSAFEGLLMHELAHDNLYDIHMTYRLIYSNNI